MNSVISLLTCCCAVPEVFLAQPQKNAEEILKLIREAVKKEAALIVFPELSITGYTCGDLFYQKTLISSSVEALNYIIRETKDLDILIAVGIPLSISGRLYNTAAILQHGKILGIVPKVFLPNNSEFYEKRWFKTGRDLNETIHLLGQDVPVSTHLVFSDRNDPEIKIGFEICEDLWAPDPPSTGLAKAGAIIIGNLSASNETVGKAQYRNELVAQQSARLNAGYCYSSSGYGESTQDLVFSGDAIIAEKGIILKKSQRFQLKSFLIDAQIDIDSLLHDRRLQSTFKDALTPDQYKEIPIDLRFASSITREYEKNPFVPQDEQKRKERSEEILSIQSLGLGTRLKKIGDKTKMVVGVSGGLDSTLALLVCKLTCDKFGIDPSQILAVTMPGFGTTDRTYDNAVSLIKELGAEFREIPIRDATTQHLEDIGHSLSDMDETYENAQARERTQILMDIANQEGGIVVGTGDLSELALGWATFNGDHMAMYGVNAGIPKTLVRYLVRYYADQSDEQLRDLLYDILDTPVSPELLPPDKEGKIQQKTEEKIGPYELHDFFLFHLVRNGFSPKKIYQLACQVFKDEYEPDYILKWLKTFIKRFFAQQFKRSTLPDGPKVGSVTLSPRGDWRMPSDVVSSVWLDELEEIDSGK